MGKHTFNRNIIPTGSQCCHTSTYTFHNEHFPCFFAFLSVFRCVKEVSQGNSCSCSDSALLLLSPSCCYWRQRLVSLNFSSILQPCSILSLKIISNGDTMLTVSHFFFSSSGQRSARKYWGADSLLQWGEVQQHWPDGLWPVCQPQSASLVASLRRGWSQLFLFFFTLNDML